VSITVTNTTGSSFCPTVGGNLPQLSAQDVGVTGKEFAELRRRVVELSAEMSWMP